MRVSNSHPLLLVLLAVLLGGCVGPQGRAADPMAVFTLNASFPAPASHPTAGAILVSLPRARPGFDSERMAYVRRPNELEYFARHRWVDTPARMIAPLLVQALDSTGAFAAVVPAPSAARAPWRLETEIVRLQQSFLEKPSRVELVLRAQLIDTARQQAIASRSFEVVLAAASDDPRGGAAAAEAAVGQLLPQLAAWCAARAAAQ